MGILDDLKPPTCENCHWWVAAPCGQVGECHHRSPVGIYDNETGKSYAEWPRTDSTDRCGDHQPAGNA
jgi:hypothetical protein